jgi:hypothetical protein
MAGVALVCGSGGMLFIVRISPMEVPVDQAISDEKPACGAAAD